MAMRKDDTEMTISNDNASNANFMSMMLLLLTMMMMTMMLIMMTMLLIMMTTMTIMTTMKTTIHDDKD